MVARFFDVWVENGAEGLIAKAATTLYVPGSRRGLGWWKLKPDYVLGLSTDLDCLIVGAYTGLGGSSNCLFTQFLLAIRQDNKAESLPSTLKRSRTDSVDSQMEEDDNLPTFVSFCRVMLTLFTKTSLVSHAENLFFHYVFRNFGWLNPACSVGNSVDHT